MAGETLLQWLKGGTPPPYNTFPRGSLEQQAVEVLPLRSVFFKHGRCLHIDGIVKFTIEEGSGDVKRVTLHVLCSNQGKDGPDHRQPDCGSNVLHKIPARPLAVPLSNKSSFVTLNGTILTQCA